MLAIRSALIPKIIHSFCSGCHCSASGPRLRVVSPLSMPHWEIQRRFRGLARHNAIDNYLASKRLVTWSADVVADDWFRHIAAKTIVQRAIQRLEAKGRGILLLHDIHPATAMALPTLLKELKARGFHV